MSNTILDDVKLHVEGSTVDDHFDSQLVDYMNAIFMVLYQIGVGPRDKPFVYDMGIGQTWDDFMSASPEREGTKTYLYKRVQMMFDPPTSSIAKEAADAIIREMEWRIFDYADYTSSFGEN